MIDYIIQGELPLHGQAFHHPAVRLFGALIALAGLLSLSTPATGFQPNTLRIGSLEIHPSLLTEVTYNNNIGLTQDKVSDVIFRQIPGVSLEWGRVYVPTQAPRLGNPHGMPLGLLLDMYLLRVREMGERDYMGRGRQDLPPGKPLESALLSSMRLRKFAVILTYEPVFINLVEHPEFNSIEQDLTFSADLRIPSGLYLRIDDHFRTSSSINNFQYEVADFRRSLRDLGVGYAVNQAAVTLGYNFYADYLAFITYSNYFFFLDDFDFSTLLTDAGLPDFVDLELVGISPDRLGFDIHSVGIFLSKPINRKTVLTLGYSIGFVQGNLEDFALRGSFLDGLVPFSVRVDKDPRDAVFHEVQFRFQKILTANQYVFGLGVPKTTLEGTFSYQVRSYEGAQLVISAFDRPIESFPLQLEDFSEFFVDLKLNSQIRPRTNVLLGFSRYPREEVGASGNVSINYRFGAVVQQEIRAKWHVGLTGAFRLRETPYEKTSERTSYNYEASANISYNLQSWLKASMIYQFLARDGEMSYNDFTGQRIRLRFTLVF
jgi:hypothetical protein